MRMTKRDLQVFKVLNKLRVLDIETIAALCDFPQYNKCADRMAILYKNGYVDYDQQDMTKRKYYRLKQKGMNVIFPGEERVSKRGKKYIHYKEPPKFVLNNLNHEITTAKVLAYLLKCNPELTIDDFKSDREMQNIEPKKRKTFKHCCDLLCEKYRIKVEVELTNKDKTRLRKNISFNSKSYIQVWIVGSNSVYNRLMAEKRRYPQFDMHVIKLDDMEKEPIVLTKFYDEFLGRNPQILEKMEEIEMLKKQLQEKMQEVEQLKRDGAD